MTVWNVSGVGADTVESAIDISITAPDEVAAGDVVTVDAVVSVSGYDGTVDARVVFAAGEKVLDERTIEIDGSAVVTFEHAFSSGGERVLQLAVDATIDGEQVRGTATHALSVTGGDEEALEDRVEREGRAAVSQSLLEGGGWQVTDESEERVFEEEQGPLTVTGDAHTTIYEDAALRDDVAERTLGNVDAPLYIFFTTWIDFSHALDDLPRDPSKVMDDVEADAKDRFVNQLRGHGLTDIAETGTGTASIATGETARVTDYRTTFAVPEMSMALPDGSELTIEGEGVPVAGLLATWHDGRDAFVAGGAYPASNYVRTIERTITDAIDLTVVIDLGLDPAAYEDELVSLVQSVAAPESADSGD